MRRSGTTAHRSRYLALIGALLAAGLGSGLTASDPPTPADPPASDRLERLLHNPLERTLVTLDAYRTDRFEEAVSHAREARELAPNEPVTAFNAGTAELAAGLHREAIASLEEAVEALRLDDGADIASALPEARFRRPRLAASTLYNLGNARFADGDLTGAVRAYEDALRLAPDHQDAKYNLELALRELERQTPPPQPSDAPQGGEGGGDGEPPPNPESQGPQDGQDRNDPAGGTQQQTEPQSSLPQDSRLQSFQDQPDMSAEEAAAILEAVENLERQQRREEAAERARSHRRGDEDW